MPFLEPGYLFSVFLVFVRIGSMMVSAPFFGHRSVPVRVKIPLAVLLAYSIVGLVPGPLPEHVAHPVGLMLAVGIEALTGVLFGFAAQFIFWSVTFAGEIIGFQMGLSIAANSALAAGAVMGIMILPFISSLADDAIRAVPRTMRDGSLADLEPGHLVLVDFRLGPDLREVDDLVEDRRNDTAPKDGHDHREERPGYELEHRRGAPEQRVATDALCPVGDALGV